MVGSQVQSIGGEGKVLGVGQGGERLTYDNAIEEELFVLLEPLENFLAGVEVDCQGGPMGRHSLTASSVGAIGAGLLRDALSRFDKMMRDVASIHGTACVRKYTFGGDNEELGRSGQVCGLVFHRPTPPDESAQ